MLIATRLVVSIVVAGLASATQGGVLLENREVNEPGPDRAVVFQNHSLLPWLTCFDTISGRRISNRSASIAR